MLGLLLGLAVLELLELLLVVVLSVGRAAVVRWRCSAMKSSEVMNGPTRAAMLMKSTMIPIHRRSGGTSGTTTNMIKCCGAGRR